MIVASSSSPVLRGAPPPRWAGYVAALALVALATGLVYPLKTVAPVVSLGVVYLAAVFVVSSLWGTWMGFLTAVASAAAFNWFHIPPTGRFTVARSENWVALAAFLGVALAASTIAEVARSRAREAEERRQEADLSAEAAKVLLGGRDPRDGLGVIAGRVAAVLGLRSAAIELDAAAPAARREVFALEAAGHQVASLILPAGLGDDVRTRVIERIVPALESILGAALERDRLQAEVVETAALRQSDVVKTALLRAVSHDLRSPLTAIVAAGEALRSPTLSDEDRDELSAAVVEEGTRLSHLIEKLLDLSRLQAGADAPHPDLVSIDELLRATAENLPGDPSRFQLSVGELPPVRADAAQLERVFANLFENAARYSRRPAGVGPRPRAARSDRRPGRRPWPRHLARRPAADLRAVLPRLRRQRPPPRVRYRAGDRQGLRRGQRGAGLGGVAPRPGHELRGRAADRGRPAAGDGVNEQPRVLVVDDEPQILRALRIILRDAGYDVLRASTAEEALDLAALRPPRGGDRRPRAPGRRRHRGHAQPAGVDATCRFSCSRPWARRARRCARWRPGPTIT